MPTPIRNIIDVFSDDNGRLSSMRVMAFITVVGGIYFFFEILTVWKTICLAKQEFIPLNLNDYVGVIASVAALFAKGLQKHIEVKGDNAQCFTFDSNVHDESSAVSSPNETSPTPTSAKRLRIPKISAGA
jgi:hypothetical protein